MSGFFDQYADLNKRPDPPARRPAKNAAPPPASPPAPPGVTNDDAPVPPTTPEVAAGKPLPLSVSEFTSQLKGALKSAFPYTVSIQGEISNYRGPNHSGHLYFSIKDSGALLPVVMFANAARGLKFKLSDGLEVVVTGRIDVYEQGGKYNFILSSITPVGTGALELAYRQVFAKLQAEGLFEDDRKKPIPDYPRTIALVTSRGAAGLQDQLKVLRRFPFLRLIVVHVPVQGEGAADKIARALDGINRHAASLGGVDLILLGRGGGSYEDLFEFSREEVARAVARSAIPIITGIGHEVDTAIADLVADHHAHTPTEAATFAVRKWREALEFIDAAAIKLRRETKRTLEQSRRALDGIERDPFFSRPDEITLPLHQRVDDREQKLALALRNRLTLRRRRLDELEQRLAKHDPRRVLLERRDRLAKAQQRLATALTARFRRTESRLAALDARLARNSPALKLGLLTQRLTTAQSRLTRAAATSLQARTTQLTALETQLRVLGPDSVLARGFTLTRRSDTGEIVRDPATLSPGERIVTRFASGEISSTVTPPP